MSARLVVVGCVLVACGTPAPRAEVAQAAATVSAQPTAIDAAVAAQPEASWVTATPIDAHVADAKGCEMPAWRGRFALSVDGTAGGVFLDHMSGVRGTVRIDPRGASSANVTFGSATFDVHVALEQSSVGFPQKPAPLGGILRVNERATARVVGGDAARLVVTPVDDDGVFEWTTTPTVSIDCAALEAKPTRWTADAWSSGTTKELVPKSERLPVRATPRGDVVARVRVGTVSVTKEERGVSAIFASTPLGLVVGFTDSAELVAAHERESSNRDRGGGGGMGRMRPKKVSCAPGTPLYVLHSERLYRVGRLHDSADPPVAPDWRVEKDGRVNLDMASSQASQKYAVLEDDFRVTNSYWHHGVLGSFVVPLGEDACVVMK